MDDKERILQQLQKDIRPPLQLLNELANTFYDVVTLLRPHAPPKVVDDVNKKISNWLTKYQKYKKLYS
jgi:hypothetical protein